MILGIIGASGFVGSSLVKHLGDLNHKIVEITKITYKKVAKLNLEFDLLINCLSKLIGTITICFGAILQGNFNPLLSP